MPSVSHISHVCVGGGLYCIDYGTTRNRSLLEAALVGYQAQATKITTAIADIQKRLGQFWDAGGVPARVNRLPRSRKHRISAKGAGKKLWRPSVGGGQQEGGGRPTAHPKNKQSA